MVMLDFNDAATARSPLSIALDYAENFGWPVFPCNPFTKAPLTEHGFKEATRDLFKIRSWWAKWPNAMIGVPTGPETFWVLDIDNDHERGKTGVQSLADMGHSLAELMDTAVAATASGGYHCLFAWDATRPPVTNARGALKRFLDVRGQGGYVVMAGSTRADGRTYTWINPPDECDLEKAPEWLYEAIQAAPATSAPFDFNTAPKAPPTPAERVARIEPGAWHENTRDLIARLVREGASDESVAAIAPRFTEPGFTHQQTINEFLTHARTARAKWGYQPKNLEAEHAQAVEEAAARFKILSITELVNVKPPEWRIDGVFPTHGSSVLYGAYETFKTFIALDMTLSLASGLDWMNRPSKPCSVLYVAGEGQVGLGIRAAGWLAAKGVNERDVRFQALPEAVALPNPGDQDALLKAIDGMKDPPEIIVLDTVTRMTGGGSLNDEKDAQGYVRGMDRLRIATGAHILNIGHSGKDKERGILGSTVLPAAMETIICVERRGDTLTLINSNPKGKQKDGPNFEDIRLRKQVVDFEHDGQPLKTVILIPDDDQQDADEDTPSTTLPARPQGANQQAVMAALKKAKGEPLGMTRLSTMTGLASNRLFETTTKLVAKGLIHEVGEEGSRRWKIA